MSEELDGDGPEIREMVREMDSQHEKASPRPDFTRATEATLEVAGAVDDAFEYHPWSSQQVLHGAAVRKVLAEAVKVIIDNVPPGPDRTVAIRKIREARMDCNSAITHNGKY